MVIDGHRSERMRQAKEALLERVKKRYPSLGKPEDEEGVVPDAVMKKILEISEKIPKPGKSLLPDKHATPAEGAKPLEEVFSGMRPQSLIAERTSDAGVDVAGLRTETFRQYTPLQVNLDANYIKQFNSLYPSQVFPFTFPYMVGGPEYFSRSSDRRRDVSFDIRVSIISNLR